MDLFLWIQKRNKTPKPFSSEIQGEVKEIMKIIGLEECDSHNKGSIIFSSTWKTMIGK